MYGTQVFFLLHTASFQEVNLIAGFLSVSFLGRKENYYHFKGTESRGLHQRELFFIKGRTETTEGELK